MESVHGKWASQQGVEAILYPDHKELPWLDAGSDVRAKQPHMVKFRTYPIVENYLSTL
jgi:hypothetical protein